MPHMGPPTWDGKSLHEKCLPIEGKLFPVIANEPFCIQIEGSDDFFFMLFSTEEKLNETVTKFLAKIERETGEKTPPYVIGRVTSEAILDAFIDMGIRIMFDPYIVDEHHTKWGEIVKEEDKYKYLDPLLN